MQQISSFPLLITNVVSTDKTGSGVASDFSASGNQMTGLPVDASNGTDPQDFTRIYQLFKLNGGNEGQGDVSLEQGQVLPGPIVADLEEDLTDVSGVLLSQPTDVSLGTTHPDDPGSIPFLLQISGQPVQEGQAFATELLYSGEVLPSAASVTMAQSTEISADSASGQVTDEILIAAATAPTAPVSQQLLPEDSTIPPPSFTRLQREERANTPTEKSLNIAQLNTLDPTREAPRTVAEARASENPTNPSLQSGELVSRQIRETAVGAGDVVQNNSVTSAKAQFELFGRESVLSGLEEGVEPDRHDRTGLAVSDVRAKVPDYGLRQYATSVGTHVNDPDWAETMNQKVVWLSGRNIKSAEIQLSPADLGPVEVKISVQNDQTTVSFNVQTASVRELLESNIHRLREMMSENGVDLTDVNVGSEERDDSFNARNDEGHESSDQHSGADDELTAGSNNQQHESQEVISVTSPNRVDFYA